jgi:hypothetical protein
MLSRRREHHWKRPDGLRSNGSDTARGYPQQKGEANEHSAGLIYMLCGATQHDLDDPLEAANDANDVSIPIGAHYMILWPYDSKLHGFPNNIRDPGAWVAFDGTSYTHLHICGSPWEGIVYHPEKACSATWTMKYAGPEDENITARGG